MHKIRDPELQGFYILFGYLFTVFEILLQYFVRVNIGLERRFNKYFMFFYVYTPYNIESESNSVAEAKLKTEKWSTAPTLWLLLKFNN
jgi:hypothetical protein